MCVEHGPSGVHLDPVLLSPCFLDPYPIHMTIHISEEGSRQRILEFLLANIGRVIEGEELRAASGNVSEWARRVRELRDEEGYQVLTHRDRRDLKLGQYLLETDKRLPTFSRSISKETRAYVLERNRYTCQRKFGKTQQLVVSSSLL